MATETSAGPPPRAAGLPRRLLFLPPALAFAGLGTVLSLGLGRDQQVLPSPLIGRPVPRFRLPPVQGCTLGLASADLTGGVSLVNVFASWCTACRLEHPVLLRLKEEGVVPIHGIDYKDPPADAAAWLDAMGDPYTRTGADRDGRVAIEWGVYGVPETFVVDADGKVVFKQVGPVTPEVYARTLGPLLARLQR